MPNKTPHKTKSIRCATGILGLDAILGGGLPCFRLYVVQGEPGSGKTTLALQFLNEGIKNGERALYITFSETKEELATVAESHHWDLSNIDIIDLSALERQLSPNAGNTLFHPSEVELNRVTSLLLKEIDRINPSRVVFDSVSEMRLLSESALRYRREILFLKQTFAGKNATVLFLDDMTGAHDDLQVQSIAHGVIGLYRLHHEFGGERRRLRVMKLRGVKFIAGHHDYVIDTGGLRVFPRMISSGYTTQPVRGQLASGLAELDSLVGGGLDYGTSNLFIGPAGSGKSTIAMKYAVAAADEGKHVAFFAFEETLSNLGERSTLLELGLEKHVKEGRIHLQKIDPAELSPGEFAAVVRDRVTLANCQVIVIDSLNGYLHAMPQEQNLLLQLHELLAYLNGQRVVTILVLAQQGMIGQMQSPIDLTYLADTVVLTRFFEAYGAVKKAVSVIKKRTGKHETTIREFVIGQGGVRVGPVLSDFQGILTGVPRYLGSDKDILKS
jgi:circadian clock protein KaiC